MPSGVATINRDNLIVSIPIAGASTSRTGPGFCLSIFFAIGFSTDVQYLADCRRIALAHALALSVAQESAKEYVKPRFEPRNSSPWDVAVTSSCILSYHNSLYSEVPYFPFGVYPANLQVSGNVLFCLVYNSFLQ